MTLKHKNTASTVLQVPCLGYAHKVAGLNVFVSTQSSPSLVQWCDKSTLNVNFKNQLNKILTFEIDTLYADNNK